MPPSPTQQPQSPDAASHAPSQPRSPQRSAALLAVLIAAETAVCTSTVADAGHGNTHHTSSRPTPPAPLCDASVPLPTLDGLSDELRRKVCSYVPWRQCLKLRALDQAWCAATEEVVRVDVLPDASPPVPAVFVQCPVSALSDTTTELALRCMHPSKWRCAVCGFCNSDTRILCGNRTCQIPCPSHRECARLFLGQLRREATVPTLKWLVEGVFGSEERPVHIVNVENHRQITTSRGKGCAWVYLQHREMADTVLSHNHRVFYDVHPASGREGVWLVAPGHEQDLLEAVKIRGYVRNRDLVMPRNALVVEFPSRQPNLTVAPAGSAVAWETAPMPPSYAAATKAPTPTPETHWYPGGGTDSPPSESGSDAGSPSSSTAVHPTDALAAANKVAARARRHQPYGWTPTSAGGPSLPTGDVLPLVSPPSYGDVTASACGTVGYEYDVYCNYYMHMHPAAQRFPGAPHAWGYYATPYGAPNMYHQYPAAVSPYAATY